MSKLFVILFYPFVWGWTFFEDVYAATFYNSHNWGVFHTAGQWAGGSLLLIPTLIFWAALVGFLIDLANSHV